MDFLDGLLGPATRLAAQEVRKVEEASQKLNAAMKRTPHKQSAWLDAFIYAVTSGITPAELSRASDWMAQAKHRRTKGQEK